MRMSEYCSFAAGMLAGMAVLVCCGAIKGEERYLRHMRRKAADLTATLVNEAGHKIICMGKRMTGRAR